ncbi:phage holin family protein [Patulibacter sp. S7RM1-6]
MPGAEDKRREASVAGVVEHLAAVTERTQHIVRDEIELAKAEVAQKAKSLGKGAAVGAAAGVFVALGGIFFLQALAWFFWWLLGSPGNQMFWGFLIVAVLLFVLAGVGAMVALKAVKRGAPPTPDMAIEEAKLIRESVQGAGKGPQGLGDGEETAVHGPARTLGTTDTRSDR